MATFSILASQTNIFEGEAVTFYIDTTEVANGTTIYWNTVQIAGTVDAAMFTDGDLSGELTVNDNFTSLTRTTTVDQSSETREFQISLMTDSVDGVPVTASEIITVDDSATAPPSEVSPFYVPGGISIGEPPQVAVDRDGDSFLRNITARGNITVNGALSKFNTDIEIESNTINFGVVTTPDDTTALNGGIVLKGATDKTIIWTTDVTKSSWTSNQDFNLTIDKEYRINDAKVIGSTALGDGVTGSQLTSVGTIDTGTWQGSVIAGTYGGTGINNAGKTITVAGNFTHQPAESGETHTLTIETTANTLISLPATGRLVGTDDVGLVTNDMLENSTININGTAVALGGSYSTPTSALSVEDNGVIRLNVGTTNHDVRILAGSNITVTSDTAADTITIAAQVPTIITYTLSTLDGDPGAAKIRLTSSASVTDDVSITTDSAYLSVAQANDVITISYTGPTLDTSSDVTFANINVGSATGAAGGQVRASGDIIAFSSSDMSLKENITPIDRALEKVKSLTGFTYDWTQDFIDKHGGEHPIYLRKRDVGISAQTALNVLPEVVVKREDGILAVKYEKMVALLVEAIKELSDEVDRLKNHGR
jgi:hypothetical protein